MIAIAVLLVRMLCDCCKSRRRAGKLGNAARTDDVLQKAIALESQSAQAHSLLSIITTFRLHLNWTNRKVVPAMRWAHKAISLNLDEPWAHAALGFKGEVFPGVQPAIVASENSMRWDDGGNRIRT